VDYGAVAQASGCAWTSIGKDPDIPLSRFCKPFLFNPTRKTVRPLKKKRADSAEPAQDTVGFNGRAPFLKKVTEILRD
jgi:hypothetical protein